jgi:hypothetical protein
MNAGRIFLIFDFLKIDFVDALINALDVPVDKLRPHHETEPTRARSASSSPRPSIHKRISETTIKPACLYVSNWTDDEKCRRRNERMKFIDAQLAERFNKKILILLSFIFLFRPYFEALIQSLDCTESDQQCFYALSVLLTMTMNPCRSSLRIH